MRCIIMNLDKVREKYKAVSKQIDTIEISRVLLSYFNKIHTYDELIDWIHKRLTFTKGNIRRSSNPLKIIELGKGRCGEFAILYTALCIAHGYRARLILDITDHVWTEVFVGDHWWMHVDPTEKRIDDPQMYERDWRKKLTKIYAYEDGVETDVTDTYKTNIYQ